MTATASAKGALRAVPPVDSARRVDAGPGLDDVGACPRCGKDSCAGCSVATERPGGPLFAPVTVGDLYKHTSDEIAWRWGQMFPAGALVLLAAFMKAGKSTLIYGAIAAMLKGLPFLDRETEQTNVLLLALEENRRDVKRRLMKFGVRPDAGLFIQFRPVPTTPSEWAALVAFVRAQQIGLIVIDTLSRCWATWGVDNENDNARVAAAVSPLLDLCRETGTTAVLLHHVGKLTTEGHGREVRGAGAILAMADQALLFDRYRAGDPCDRIIRIIGRYDESPAETVIRYDKAAGTYSVVSGELQDENARGAERVFPQLLAYLRRVSTTGATVREVRQNVTGRGTTKDRALVMLVESEKVLLRDGRYYHADYPPTEEEPPTDEPVSRVSQRVPDTAPPSVSRVSRPRRGGHGHGTRSGTPAARDARDTHPSSVSGQDHTTTAADRPDGETA